MYDRTKLFENLICLIQTRLDRFIYKIGRYGLIRSDFWTPLLNTMLWNVGRIISIIYDVRFLFFILTTLMSLVPRISTMRARESLKDVQYLVLMFGYAILLIHFHIIANLIGTFKFLLGPFHFKLNMVELKISLL